MIPDFYIYIVLFFLTLLLSLIGIKNKSWAFYVWLPVVVSINVPLFVVVVFFFVAMMQPLAAALVGIFLPALLVFLIAAAISYFSFPKQLPNSNFIILTVIIYLITATIILRTVYTLNTHRIDFYVVDQNNNPVDKVLVKYDMTYGHGKTDKNGKMSLRFWKFATNVKCEKIHKKGYALINEIETYNYPLRGLEDSKFTVKIRKMGDTTFLLHNRDDDVEFEGKKEYAYYNIVSRKIVHFHWDEDPRKTKDHMDLIFHVLRNADEEKYNVSLYSISDPNGVSISDSPLPIAPQEGYVSQIDLLVKYREEFTKFLHIKNRNPTLYSRMELTFKASSEALEIAYNVAMNPYGSPNLEYEPDLPKDLVYQLSEEAEDALKAGVIPTEPDSLKIFLLNQQSIKY